ncbi:MAG TPA: DUF87 domain-containing protein [Thermoplasmata archaeon]|nr:DUF87 domain-containing protein [Thermoplasmata archaeon]
MTTTRRRSEGPSFLVAPSGFDLPVLLSELPREVPFGFLGAVLPTTERVDLRLQVHRIDRGRSLSLLEGAGAVADAELQDGRPDAVARPSELELESEGARALAREVASGDQELYRVGVSLHARGSTRPVAERNRRALVRRLEALGFRTRVPLYEAAETAAPPDLAGSERRPVGYWHTLPTDGVAAFFPFVDECVAEPGGALVGLLLEDASPVILDRWRHASHSWGIFGTTGSGKSFAAALLALRSRWMRPDLDLYVIDPLGEFSGLAEALGGQVVPVAVPGADRINPLDPGPGDRTAKAARVAAVIRALFPSLTDPEGAVLDGSLARLYERGPGVPTLGDLVEEVGAARGVPERLLGLLDVFRTGSLRHLDGPTTVRWDRTPIVLDLAGVSEAHLPFHLAYLLDAVYGRLQATPNPKLVVVDEAHLLARNPPTAEFLDRLVRHVRHYRAGLLLASQNPDDFLRSENGRSLLRNLRASLLLRLPEVSEAARRFFGLTEAESDWLPRTRLPREAGYSEGLLRFGASHLPIAIVASTPEYELLTGARNSLSPGPDAPGTAPGAPPPPSPTVGL